jgi:hypothetical protein
LLLIIYRKNLHFQLRVSTLVHSPIQGVSCHRYNIKMASKLYGLSSDEKVELKLEFQALYSSNFIQQDSKGCHIWGGEGVYGRKRVTVNGKSFRVGAHTLSYFLSNEQVETGPGLEVSHLCHQKKMCSPRPSEYGNKVD